MSPSTGVSVFRSLHYQSSQNNNSYILHVSIILKTCYPSAEFHIIVCGLDSIIARRWMNGMLVGTNCYLCFIVVFT